MFWLIGVDVHTRQTLCHILPIRILIWFQKVIQLGVTWSKCVMCSGCWAANLSRSTAGVWRLLHMWTDQIRSSFLSELVEFRVRRKKKKGRMNLWNLCKYFQRFYFSLKLLPALKITKSSLLNLGYSSKFKQSVSDFWSQQYMIVESSV